MKLKDKVVVITGAGSGIGKALAQRAASEGARGILVSDLNGDNAKAVAEEVGGIGLAVDVSDEVQVVEMVARAESEYGHIDLYCSNAGIFFIDKGHAASTENEKWQKIWEVNVMAHIYASRAALPKMIDRGGGYFLITASAAGLLSQIGSATYSTTKHAAVGYAESLAISHGNDGIKVSVLCPQAVRTGMTESLGGPGVAGVDGMMEVDAVADAVIAGLDKEGFLILPHAEVETYMQRKTADYDRWLGGMRRLRDKFMA